jgi:hypothetical protein
MSQVLKGNFQTRNPVETPDAGEESLEQRFEKQALKRLGGSIAFVAKQKVHWGDDGDDGDAGGPGGNAD